MSSGPEGRLIRTPALPILLRGEDSSDKAMEYQLAALAACAAVFAYVLLRRGRKLSAVRDVPGPVNPSWIFGMFPVGRLGPFASPVAYSTDRETLQGHQWYLQVEEAGGTERRFLRTFGNVVRWNGPFGVRLAFHEHTLVTRIRSLH